MRSGLLAVVLLLVCTGAAPAGDVPMCFGQPATIVGSEGFDDIRGTEGPDVIASLGGSDFIRALAGDDLVCAGEGAGDSVYGGAGNDKLDGGEGVHDRVSAGERGPVTVDLAAGVSASEDGTDTILGFEDVLTFRFKDQLLGDDGPNHLRAGKGADYLEGRGGGDELGGQGGTDTGDGGAGSDQCRSGRYINCEG